MQSPKGVPLWVYLGAGMFATLVAVGSLVAGGSWLPLVIQIPLIALTPLPWLPAVRQKWLSWGFVILSLLPTLVFTWTGGSPLLFAMLALSASRVALASTLPKSLAYGLGAAGIVVGRQFVAHHDLNWMMWKTYVELGLALGWAMRSQRLLIVRTREARDEHAQLAALEERRRIARDVHDVLAHTLTILMVHLNSARLSVKDDPEGTAEILDEVAAHGRHALEEIRRTVGLLSTPSPAAASAGPGDVANDLVELVDSYRKVGVDVDLRLHIEMEHLSLLAEAPSAIRTAGYRIVQEALANATKHAPGARVEVWIGVDDAGLHMRCSNELTPSVVVLEIPSGGNGVPGMRERVQDLGGTFSAGLVGKSWVVRADLPLSKADASRRSATTLGRAS